MDKLAKKVSQWIGNRAEKEWQSMIGDDNEAIPDEDALICQAIEDLREWLADEMANHPDVDKAISEARVEIRETAAEHAAYNRAMNGGIHSQLQWHGMNVKDFI